MFGNLANTIHSVLRVSKVIWHCACECQQILSVSDEDECKSPEWYQYHYYGWY